MNKDFSKEKLLSFSQSKQLKVLLDLALFIEKNSDAHLSKHFDKLRKYHAFLKDTQDEYIKKLNKDFVKVKGLDKQFQLYLMNLERFFGQSQKEYDFLVARNDISSVQQSFPILCILDSIRSAHNIGAMFRNAECFGLEKIYLTGYAPGPEHIQVQKTSMGTDSLVPWEHADDISHLIEKLKNDGYKVLGIETTKKGHLLEHFQYQGEKLALIFGHEQFGLSLEVLNLCDDFLKINLFGQKNSLNVSVSQAIVLNHLTNNSREL